MVYPQTAMLSAYPEAKVIVDCDQCGVHAKYDKLEMLEVGGDRPLLVLLAEIVRRKGCTLKELIPAYDKCRAIYSNLPADKPAAPPNAYAKAKGQF